ncbi:MAG TPA: hypothetical protein VHZ74_10595 [Bryobacteraceae bacterium]|jgi:hypothetical protein|nr:hypothetical protein [Bryobacteraceae bacterium]
MINSSEITVLNDIRERVEALTQAQFDWTGRRIDNEVAKGERIIGTVTNRATQGLYVLSLVLRTDSAVQEIQASAALEKNFEDEHRREASLLADLADVVREMFWAQAKIDRGCYERLTLCLRKDFTLVACKGHASPFSFLIDGPGAPEK